MIWIILAIIILLTITGVILDDKLDQCGDMMICSLMFGIPVACIVLGFGIWLGVSVGSGNLLDEKIELARNQNADIEQKIKVVVDNYIGYESDTYKSLKPEEAILAASVYPELQSNTLVQEQIKVYEENNKKITSLREQQIDLRVKKWWLYFGN